MSLNPVSAFNLLISIQGRDVVLERDAISETVKMAPSNYFRNLASVEETIVEGKEFVVSKTELDRVSFPAPERGDTIVDAELGVDTVDAVKPLIIMGEIAGYRLRTA